MDERFSEYDPKVVKVIRTKAREVAAMNLGSFNGMDIEENYKFVRDHSSNEFERTIMDNPKHRDEIDELSTEYGILANDLLGEYLVKNGEI